MQREIKFRGKRVDNGEWVYGYLIECGVSGKAYIFPNGWDVDESDRVGHEGFLRLITFEVISETVGQYTGLKDKNGKEIYEGDVVKGFLPEMANEPERVGLIRWGLYGWIVDFKLPKYEAGIGKVGFCSFRNYEVIGNIYENPELLEVSK